MKAVNLTRSQVLTIGVPGLVMLTSVLLALSPLLKTYPELAVGITYDLTLTAPLAYFLFIRKKPISKITIVPFFVAGVVLASFLLPASQQGQLDLIKTFVFPVVELVALSVIVTKVYRGVQSFKAKADAESDFYLILKKSSLETLGNPRIAAIFSTEMAAIYYALFSWKRPKVAADEFTNYKESGSIALFCALLLVLTVETFVFHILLAEWSVIIAWVLTISSIYFALQIIGHLKAMSQRYSRITDRELVLKYGLFGDAKMNLRDIGLVEVSGRELEDASRKIEHFSLLKGMESHNVILHFKQPQTIASAYGMTKQCDVLLLHMDDADAFSTRLNVVLTK